MQNNTKYTYRYPENMDAKPMIFCWSVSNMSVLMVLGLISLVLLTKTGNVFPAALTAVYAFFSGKFLPDTRPMIEYFNDLMNYLTKPQIWVYDPSFKSIRKAGKKDPKSKVEIDSVDVKETQNRNFGKLVFVAILGVAMIVFMGYMVLFSGKQQADHDNEVIKNSISLTFTDDISTEIEWYGKTPDLLSYVESASGEVTVSPEKLDTSKIGTTTVTYTVTDKSGVSQEFTKDFTVADTLPADITFKEDNVIVKVGSTFDPTANIVSVIDPVDGEFTLSEESGYMKYTVASNVNTAEEADFEVTVTALDSNGNRSEKTYYVAVRE